MNYIGSKLSLKSFIKDTILEISKIDNENKVFADLFAGTGVIGNEFKKMGYKVISNDIQHYSYIILKNLIEGDKTSEIPEQILKQIENIILIIIKTIYFNICLNIFETFFNTFFTCCLYFFSPILLFSIKYNISYQLFTL